MISRIDVHLVHVSAEPHLQNSGVGVVTAQPAQRTWVAQPAAWPRKAFAGAIAQVKKRYKQLKNRYGPRYTSAMVGTAFVTFFLPIPAVSLISVALIAVIAEIHRAISKRVGCRQSPPC